MLSGRKKYFEKKLTKQVLNKKFDLPITLLANDITYGKASSDYRDFLYGTQNEEGFIAGFNSLRKNSIDQAVDLHRNFFSEINKDFDVEKFVSRARNLSRKEYWKTKNYLSKELENPQVYGDDEELIPLSLGKESGLEVHHLNRLKSFVNEQMSVRGVLKAVDPKYQVSMTKQGHLRGENIGHDGYYANNPQLTDPYEIESSIPNDYYQTLEEKRNELVNTDISDIATGGVALLTATFVLEDKRSLLHRSLEKRKLGKGLIRMSSMGIGAYSREGCREIIVSSDIVQKVLFDFRDELLLAGSKSSTIVSNTVIDGLSNIDLLADATSVGALSVIIQSGKLYIDYRDAGHIDKAMLRKHGTQAFTKTLILGGGKYLLTMSSMDPTGATAIVVTLYIGGSYIYSYNEVRKNNKIQEFKNDVKLYQIKGKIRSMPTN